MGCFTDFLKVVSKLVVRYLFSKHASEFRSTVYKAGHWTLCSSQVALSKLAFSPFFMLSTVSLPKEASSRTSKSWVFPKLLRSWNFCRTEGLSRASVGFRRGPVDACRLWCSYGTSLVYFWLQSWCFITCAPWSPKPPNTTSPSSLDSLRVCWCLNPCVVPSQTNSRVATGHPIALLCPAVDTHFWAPLPVKHRCTCLLPLPGTTGCKDPFALSPLSGRFRAKE